MPPAIVKTIRDVIYWQYAKLISKSVGIGNEGRGFQMKKFLELRDGKIHWSTEIREWEKEHEFGNKCVYCESIENLTTEHILPKCCGGPDNSSNAIRICKKCNSSKGGKGLYEWFTEERRDEIPRIAEGEYLKLLYELHEKNGTLDSQMKNLCPICGLKKKCVDEGHDNKITVYCLEGIFKK